MFHTGASVSFYTYGVVGSVRCVYKTGLTAIAQEPAAPAGDQFKAPANVAAAPAEAAKTQSGLASLVLKKGTGTEKPSATDTVKVHYTGWPVS